MKKIRPCALRSAAHRVECTRRGNRHATQILENTPLFDKLNNLPGRLWIWIF